MAEKCINNDHRQVVCDGRIDTKEGAFMAFKCLCCGYKWTGHRLIE